MPGLLFLITTSPPLSLSYSDLNLVSSSSLMPALKTTPIFAVVRSKPTSSYLGRFACSIRLIAPHAFGVAGQTGKTGYRCRRGAAHRAQEEKKEGDSFNNYYSADIHLRARVLRYRRDGRCWPAGTRRDSMLAGMPGNKTHAAVTFVFYLSQLDCLLYSRVHER